MARNMSGLEECLNGLEGRVTEVMNAQLLWPFGEEEIDFALAQMHPLKSPGPEDDTDRGMSCNA